MQKKKSVKKKPPTKGASLFVKKEPKKPVFKPDTAKKRKDLKLSGINKNLVKRKDKNGRKYYVDRKTGKRASIAQYENSKAFLKEKKVERYAKNRLKGKGEFTKLGHLHPSSLEKIISDTLFELGSLVFIKLTDGEILRIKPEDSYKLLMMLSDIKEAIIEENTVDGKLINSDFLQFSVYEDINKNDILIDLNDFIYHDQSFDVMFYFYKYF